jgi:hypothetical protein
VGHLSLINVGSGAKLGKTGGQMGILISLTTYTIIRSDMSDDTKLSYSGYLGLVSCVLCVLLTPFYVIDGIKTRKQLNTPPDKFCLRIKT